MQDQDTYLLMNATMIPDSLAVWPFEVVGALLDGIAARGIALSDARKHLPNRQALM